MLVVLGIGSNLGDREAYIKHAVELLAENAISAVRVSSFYESPALLKPGAPAMWDIPYLNIAIAGETSLAPQALLKMVKTIERRIGRSCSPAGLWAPREIDIDILAYGEEAINENGLQVPHAGLLERDFALLPFADLEPNWRFPVSGDAYHKTAFELSQKFWQGCSAVKVEPVAEQHDYVQA